MNHRLIHDHAHLMAQEILAVVRNCLYDHEHRDAWEQFYMIAKAGLEKYETERERMLHRLRPMSNCSEKGFGQMILRVIVNALNFIAAYWWALLDMWCPWPVLLGLIIWVIRDAKNMYTRKYTRLMTVRPSRN